MSLFMTIPTASGLSLDDARLHTGNLLEGLTAGESYICYHLLPSGAPFVYTGVPVLQDEPALPEGSVEIALAQDGASYQMTVAEGVGTVEINGQTYAFNTREILGKAPLLLGAPAADVAKEEATTAETVNYTAAPYLYDPAGGTPVITLSTLRSDEVLGTGAHYAPTAFDRVAGFRLRQEVVNSLGVGTAETEVLAPLSYATDGLTFGKTHGLIKADGVQPEGAGSLFVALNVRPQDRAGTFFRDTTGIRMRAYFNGGSGRVFVATTDEKRLLNYSEWYAPGDPFEAEDNVCLLIEARPDFSRFASYRNGQFLRTWSRNHTNVTTKIDTTLPFNIGLTDFGVGVRKDYAFEGTLMDLRIWTDIEQRPDVTSKAVAALFIDETGAPKHPAIANMLFGMPRIWVPTDPAEANALVNLGAAGDFTGKTGDFA